MGIPYSREINKAFEELNKAYGQVTPLIEAAYEVLETTKNISLLLAGIQVLTVFLLALILLALLGLLITMNPDLEKERQELVTPILHWVAGWAEVMKTGTGWFSMIAVMFIFSVGLVVLMTRYSARARGLEESEEPGDTAEDGQDDDGDKDKEK